MSINFYLDIFLLVEPHCAWNYSQTHNIFIYAIYQGWPTSRRPRATFLILYYHKELHHIHGHTWTTPHLFITHSQTLFS